MGSVLNRILIAVSAALASSALIALLWGAGEARAAGTVQRLTQATGACTDSESWVFSDGINPVRRRAFGEFLDGKLSPAMSFAEALSLRRKSLFGENRHFAEYWISRSLYRAGLIHTAHRGFTVIAASRPAGAHAGIQMAAIDCLVRIHRRYPSITIHRRVLDRLPLIARLPQGALFSRALSEAAAVGAMKAAGDSVTAPRSRQRAASRSRYLRLIKLVRPGSPEAELVRGMYAAAHGKPGKALSRLSAYFNSKRPERLKRFDDHAALLLARAQYATGRYAEAAATLQGIEKSSNQLTHAMNELSWAYLRQGKLREAIGTAVSLQSGHFRNTFAPESVMVMAMALNELCRYPESLQALRTFRRRYRGTFEWLASALKGGSRLKKGRHYELVIGFLKGTEKSVPPAVVSEWLRSPLFLSRQDEVNLLFGESRASATLGEAGAGEQARLSRDLLEFARDLRERYVKAKIRLGPGDRLPDRIYRDLETLKFKVVRYRRFRAAAPVWGTVLANQKKRAAGLKKVLVRRIDTDLRAISRRMLAQLQSTAENNQMIEVEIYNGATQDIVWQNAHPDYKKVAKRLDEERKDARDEQGVWNWGRVASGLGGTGEVWEDEVGSFQADLYDNCENKYRYLELKREAFSSLGGTR